MSRILTDLTQRRQRPHHPGFAFLTTPVVDMPRRSAPRVDREGCLRDTGPKAPRLGYIIAGRPYETIGTSEGTEAMCKGPVVSPARETNWAKAQRQGGPRRPKRNKQAFYRPVDGHQEGPLFSIEDRATGVRLATCRGVLHHVMAEAEKFAQAQGLTLADIQVRIVE